MTRASASPRGPDPSPTTCPARRPTPASGSDARDRTRRGDFVDPPRRRKPVLGLAQDPAGRADDRRRRRERGNMAPEFRGRGLPEACRLPRAARESDDRRCNSAWRAGTRSADGPRRTGRHRERLPAPRLRAGGRGGRDRDQGTRGLDAARRPAWWRQGPRRGGRTIHRRGPLHQRRAPPASPLRLTPDLAIARRTPYLARIDFWPDDWAASPFGRTFRPTPQISTNRAGALVPSPNVHTVT